MKKYLRLPITLSLMLILVVTMSVGYIAWDNYSYTRVDNPVIRIAMKGLPIINTAYGQSVDLLCDGTDDHVQWQSAANSLSSGGKLVDLCGTAYYWGDGQTVTFQNGNITIEGAGGATYFDGDGVTPLFSDGGYDNCLFKDLQTDAGGITRNNANNSYAQNVWIDGTYYFEGPEGGAGGGNCSVAIKTLDTDAGSYTATDCDGSATIAGGDGISTAEAAGIITVTSSLGTSITTDEITDGTIAEADLHIGNAAVDEYVLTYESDDGLFYWEADQTGVGGSGGDDVFVDGGNVTDPDFVSTGDIDFVDTANVITANIKEDVITKSMFANEDWGDMTVAGNVVTLDANSVDISDNTNLTAGTGISLVGDTLSATLGTSIDISSESNLAVSAPISLTDDTVGLNYDATLTLSGSDLATVIGNTVDASEIETGAVGDDEIDYVAVTFEDFTGTVDISDHTNLANSTGILLVGDTLSATLGTSISTSEIEADAVDDTKIDFSTDNAGSTVSLHDLLTGSPTSNYIPKWVGGNWTWSPDSTGGEGAFDSTEVNDTTWGNATEALITWTWNASSGTDPIIDFGNGVVNVSTGELQEGGFAVFTTNDGALADDDLSDDDLDALQNVGAMAESNGDLLIYNTTWTNLGIGANNTVLYSNSSLPLWGQIDISAMTNLIGGTGITLTDDTLSCDLGTSIETGEITDDTITPADLHIDNAEVDEYVLTYELDTGNFAWQEGVGDDMGSVNTEAELEDALGDVTDVFTDNDGALDDDDVTAADVGTVSDNLDDVDASVEWEDAVDLDAVGNVTDDSHNHTTATISGLSFVDDFADVTLTNTLGDLIYGNSTHWIDLAIGNDKDILYVNSNVPAWQSIATLVTAGDQLTWDGTTLDVDATVTLDTEWDTWEEHPALASAYILVGNATNNAVAVAMSGDVFIDNTGATTIQADSVALTVDTTGNYLANVAAGEGIDVAGALGEGVTQTVSIEEASDTNLGGARFDPDDFDVAGGNVTLAAVARSVQVMACSMTANTTNPCGSCTAVDYHGVTHSTVSFDNAGGDYASFAFEWPSTFGRGGNVTVTFHIVAISDDATSGTVIGSLKLATTNTGIASAVAQTSTATWATDEEFMQGVESDPITVYGTPSAGDMCVGEFQVSGGTLDTDPDIYSIVMTFWGV